MKLNELCIGIRHVIWCCHHHQAHGLLHGQVELLRLLLRRREHRRHRGRQPSGRGRQRGGGGGPPDLPDVRGWSGTFKTVREFSMKI